MLKTQQKITRYGRKQRAAGVANLQYIKIKLIKQLERQRIKYNGDNAT
jgi:hypothetical protein